MRLQSVLWAPLLASAATAYTPASTTQTDLLAANGFLNLGINQLQLALSGKLATCTLANVAVRREW
jgi:tyrosinase